MKKLGAAPGDGVSDQPGNGEGEEALNAEMLAAATTRREAAELLLENFHSAMVATAP